ncbi:hypothetical protein V5O48_015317 [Marasmius crinis-equi]|uniref:Uncharacterized protein n=1 Tax=Marasmius crinis-equi TaxID=585013 RepID=A0ABR3EUV6_9AGAR
MVQTVSVRKQNLALDPGSQYNVQPRPAAKIKKETKKATNNIPIPNTQILKKTNEQRKKASAIGSDVISIRKMICCKCNKLAEIYDMKPRYFMDMLYQGGARNTKLQNEPNVFNAYKLVVAHERKEAGEKPLPLLQLQDEISPEYHELDKKKKTKYITKYLEICDKDKREKTKQPSMKKKRAQCSKVVKEMLGKAMGLKTCVGVKMLALVVKNHVKPYLDPQWIATDPWIQDYVSFLFHQWDLVTVGKKLEAFAVAGCDALKVLKNQKDLAEALKKNTTTVNQSMHYEKFDTSIMMTHKVMVEGWPKVKFQSPYNFTGALEPLIGLHEAWENGKAKFRKLSDTEYTASIAKHVEDIENRDLVPKECKKQSNAGVSRKRKGQDDKPEEPEKLSQSEDDVLAEPKATKKLKKAVVQDSEVEKEPKTVPKERKKRSDARVSRKQKGKDSKQEELERLAQNNDDMLVEPMTAKKQKTVPEAVATRLTVTWSTTTTNSAPADGTQVQLIPYPTPTTKLQINSNSLPTPYQNPLSFISAHNR